MAQANKTTKTQTKKVDGATQQAPNVEGKKTTKTQTKKEYKFTSKNKYLSCAGLGVQFINGTASTTSLEVARALAKIDGVELIEE